MADKRILVVDDEESILKIIEYALSEEGYEVRTALDAATAEAAFAEFSPDLLILDIMLPDRSGLELARDLRAHSDVPIIMLSARADEVDRILGLEIGADDYMTKPFSPRELVSRVRNLLRRAESAREEVDLITIGELHIDGLARQVTLGERVVNLTRSEYDILLHLARHPGTAFSREAILVAVRDLAPVGDERGIDVHIHNIREKLEPDPRSPSYLLTVRGYGYRLREP